MYGVYLGMCMFLFHHVFVHVCQMSRDLPNLARYVCWQIPGWDAKPTSPKPIWGRGPQRNSWQSINKPRRICHLFIIMLGWCQDFISTNPCRKVNMFLGLLGERKQWAQTSRVLRETKFYDFSALRCWMSRVTINYSNWYTFPVDVENIYENIETWSSEKLDVIHQWNSGIFVGIVHKQKQS